MTDLTAVRVDTETGGNVLKVTFSDGRTHRFHAIWLRDNALDPETRDPGNGQRLIRIEDIPAEIHIASATSCGTGGVRVRFEPGGHESAFPAEWLATNAYDTVGPETAGRPAATAQLWNGEDSNRLREHNYRNLVRSDHHRFNYLDDLVRRGAALVCNAPAEDGTVLKIAELSGPVRETNYGRLFDVRAEPNPINLAYSGLGLQAHTDNPYRDPAPTVQVLHCLENSVDGGDTTLVDGFAAACHLRDTDPGSFNLLSRHPARFRFDGDGKTDLRARRPLIELSPDGELLSVRFNNRSAAPLADVPFDRVEAWYEAWRAFASAIANPAFQTGFSLSPGMAFVVDNRRILHARSAFSSGGKRWLQGCYADMDAVESSWRVLSA